MIVLIRIDERLVHGQVVVAWGRRLRVDRYAVVDDALAASEWEQEIYRLGAGNSEIVFSTVSDAAERIEEWCGDSSRTVLLTRDVETMERLAQEGVLQGRDVNLGGLHHRNDRKRRLSYVHLSASEEASLLELERWDARVEARDLPEAPSVTLASLLG